MLELRYNDELILKEIVKHEKSGIFENHLIENCKTDVSEPTVKRIIAKLYKSGFITKQKFGKQVKLFANPELPKGREYSIINANIHQSFIISDKHYSLTQIIDLHNLSPVAQPFPVGVYLDRCYPLPSKPKITIDDYPAKYDIIETAPHEIRFKIRGMIPPHGLCKRSDKMQFNMDYYHFLHIERPTHFLSIKANYKSKQPPLKYPLCEEWVNGTVTNTYQFTQISKNFFQLEITKPVYPIAYYKTLFFPKPKDR